MIIAQGRNRVAYKIIHEVLTGLLGERTEQITSESSISHQIMCLVQQTTTAPWSSFSINVLTLPSNRNRFHLPITDAYALLNVICWVTYAEVVF